jgi:N-acetylmuramoyl-L-alanine amidase
MDLIERASPNFDPRPVDVALDMLVLHYTGMPSADAALARLGDPASRVSAHYVIDEDGAVYRMVPEGARAWHAGAAYWRGSTDINARSIGIELVNPGHEYGYRPFTEAQMAALEILASGILERHGISPRNVVGHADVAPARKKDPGELFDWARLARAGIGLWPEAPATEVEPADPMDAMLARYGYETTDAKRAIEAFQRHFRPARVNGRADGETIGRLAGVLALCRRRSA